MTPAPRSVYLHLPFCTRRCPYCDFATEALPRGLAASDRVARYTRALRREIEQAPPAPASTVFFGGGTPTVMPPADLLGLLELLAQRGGLDGAEITCEANPTTVEAALLGELRAGGVNRLSLGVQSFDDGLLRAIGRNHSAGEATAAFDAARRAGFARINLDLMFNLPGQSLAAWRSSLETLLALAPEHVSCYSLTVEPETPFGEWVEQGRVTMPSDDLDADQYELAMELLGAAGYRQYEISNWALPGEECRHNLTYWYNEPYRGFGLSAASYESGRRWVNHRRYEPYVAAIERGDDPLAEAEEPDRRRDMSETMFCGLRLNRGVERARFAARYGDSVEAAFGQTLAGLVERGLLECVDEAWRLTARGRMLANQVFREFC